MDIIVSVIVPAYNVKEYIEECISSLLHQTLKEIEIIIVDDGSNDGTEIICEKLANENDNICVIHKENGGQGSARNVGLKVAKGQYVYFMDSDDYIQNNTLEMLLRKTEENQLDVVLFSAFCFSNDEGIIYNEDEYKRSACLNTTLSGKDMFQQLVEKNECYTSIPLRFYRTGFLKSRGYLFPEHIIHEDELYAFWSLIQAERVECIAEQFYHRRFRAGSTMTSKQAHKSFEGYVYTWEKMVASLNELEDWTEEEVDCAIKFANVRLEIALNLYANSFHKKQRQEYKREINQIQKILQSNPRLYKNNPQLCLLAKSLFFFSARRKLHNAKRYIVMNKGNEE